jgi:hypothetical protein
MEITKVSPRNPNSLNIGQWFVMDGWGWIIMTDRGVVVVDTKAELQEEINNLESMSVPA